MIFYLHGLQAYQLRSLPKNEIFKIFLYISFILLVLVLVSSIMFQEGQILSQIVGGALSFCATLYLIRACGRLTPLIRGRIKKKLI